MVGPARGDVSQRLVPFLWVAVLLTVLGAATGTLIDQPVLFGAAGLVWSVVLAALATWLTGWEGRWRRAANGSVFLAAFVAGFAFGNGVLYQSLMTVVASERPQYLPLFYLDAPAEAVNYFPYFYNTSLELLLLPGALLLNWHLPTRRNLILIGALLFYAQRLCSYLYFVPAIFDFERMTPAQLTSTVVVEDVRQWILLSWTRTGVDGLLFALLLLAVAVPFLAARTPLGPSRPVGAPRSTEAIGTASRSPKRCPCR